MPFVIESTEASVTSSEEFFYTVLLTVTAPASSLTQRRLRGRLFVDAVEIPFKKATFSVSAGQTDAQLSIELANLANRSLFTRTASIKLDVQEYLSGSWGTIKTYCDGAILATSNYQLQNSGNNPNDTFSVTVQSVLQQTLNLTPEQTHVLYDPVKTTIEEDSIEVVAHIDGTLGTPTVTPVSGLHLGDVMQYLADLYSLDGYITNINYEPWKLTRVDFPGGQPYWNTLAGIIGNHSPRISIKNNYLVIEDGTLTDYVSARVMGLSKWSAIQFNKTIERFKGCYLSYQLNAGGWDYYELRQEGPTYQYFGGVSGQYPLTIIEEWYQDFYRTSQPNTPVHSQLFSTKELQYSDGATLVAGRNEILSYNFGQSGVRPTRRETKEWAKTKVPQAWATYNSVLASPHNPFAAAGFSSGAENSYSSTTDADHVNALVLTGSNQTQYVYKPLRDRANEVIASQTDTESRGLISRDSENEQLEEPFDQEYGQAIQSGNRADAQGSYWGTTNFNTEVQKAEKNRKVTIKNRGRNPLNGGVPRDNFTDRRIGDIGDSDIQYETKPVYITEGADATATLWRQVNGGEAPLVVLQPLCHRLNKSQDFPGGIQAELPNYDETIEIGLVFDPLIEGRTSSAGIFEVTGYTDVLASVEEGGFKTSIQARQIADGSSEILDAWEDTDALQLPLNGSAVIRTFERRCVDGHTISLLTGATSLATIEIRQEDEVSWHDIEASAYDLSPFAGTTETFQLRFDPDAVGVASLRFRVGPLVPEVTYTYIFNDDADPVYNDGALIRTIE